MAMVRRHLRQPAESLMSRKPSAGAAVADGDRIVLDDELVDLLDLAKRRGAAGISPTMLGALKTKIDEALSQHARVERDAVQAKPWRPTKDQIWSNGMRDKDGTRLTAWTVFERHYAPIPYQQRPYAHQMRQHAGTHELYRALCVVVSRNKSRGERPSSIAELFPMTREARGGSLQRSSKKRG